jgi:hypothetical protein
MFSGAAMAMVDTIWSMPPTSTTKVDNLIMVTPLSEIAAEPREKMCQMKIRAKG